MRVGCHLSIAGGFRKAARYAVRLELEAMQIFTRSPRGGKAKPLDPADVSEFIEIRKAHDIRPVVVHVPYYVNLATMDPVAQEYTREIIADEIRRAETLGADFVVTHLGHSTEPDAISTIARALDRILADTECSNVTVLLENTAGQGKEIGTTFSEIGEVLCESEHAERLGLCLDTCHAFAAGYDLTDAALFEQMLDEVDRSMGLQKLRVIHANDSKHPVGSKKDRHEHIGKGYIGDTGMGRVMTAPEIKAECAILETPMIDFESDIQDVRALKALRHAGVR